MLCAATLGAKCWISSWIFIWIFHESRVSTTELLLKSREEFFRINHLQLTVRLWMNGCAWLWCDGSFRISLSMNLWNDNDGWDPFQWILPAGRSAILRYQAAITDGLGIVRYFRISEWLESHGRLHLSDDGDQLAALAHHLHPDLQSWKRTLISSMRNAWKRLHPWRISMDARVLQGIEEEFSMWQLTIACMHFGGVLKFWIGCNTTGDSFLYIIDY